MSRILLTYGIDDQLVDTIEDMKNRFGGGSPYSSSSQMTESSNVQPTPVGANLSMDREIRSYPIYGSPYLESQYSNQPFVPYGQYPGAVGNNIGERGLVGGAIAGSLLGGIGGKIIGGPGGKGAQIGPIIGGLAGTRHPKRKAKGVKDKVKPENEEDSSSSDE